MGGTDTGGLLPGRCPVFLYGPQTAGSGVKACRFLRQRRLHRTTRGTAAAGAFFFGAVPARVPDAVFLVEKGGQACCGNAGRGRHSKSLQAGRRFSAGQAEHAGQPQ